MEIVVPALILGSILIMGAMIPGGKAHWTTKIVFVALIIFLAVVTVDQAIVSLSL